MFYLFFGEDTFRSRQKLHLFIESLTEDKSRPFSLSRIDADTFDKSVFEELTRGASLFGEKYIVVCEGVFENPVAGDFIKENIGLCGRSENIFIFWEESDEGLPISSLKKHAEKIEEFKFLTSAETKKWLKEEVCRKGIDLRPGTEEELIINCGKNLWLLSAELEKRALSSKSEFMKNKAEKVNIFHISDAIAEKDKGKGWLLFQKAVLAGMDVEEIFWKITWQIKNLLIVKKLLPLESKKIAQIAGLHPYVAQKTAFAAKNFSEDDLIRYSAELVNLYHNSRRGLSDFETGIEKFLIKL